MFSFKSYNLNEVKDTTTIVKYILDGNVLKTYRYMTLIGDHLRHIKKWLAVGELPDGTLPKVRNGL